MEYRVSVSRKPTVRVYAVDGKERRLLASVTGWRADLIRRRVLRRVDKTEYMRFRDGRLILSVDESTAVRVALAAKAIAPLRDRERAKRIADIIVRMDRGELHWWYSLFLRVGWRALSALRRAYRE
ncbi:MAG: hypothetical protein DRO06_02000 [Thermoproteota archaeon]|mgnify:CR=1 FL=1|nr:MAG: hypothetical protein DRO06_02000 [Candidatus Korarchaeota archaeon]